MENYVSMELFDERTRNIQESLTEVKTELGSLREDLKIVPVLKDKVDAHDEFIRKVKTYGIKVLLFLAGSGAGTLGAIKIKDLLTWLGF